MEETPYDFIDSNAPEKHKAERIMEEQAEEGELFGDNNTVNNNVDSNDNSKDNTVSDNAGSSNSGIVSKIINYFGGFL